jgi:4-hydroxybenzoate polyprenyltransferase
MLLASAASTYAHHASIAYWVLIVLFLVCSIPAILFIRKFTAKSAKFIEYSSAIWTFGMYLTLGGIPMLIKLLFN